MNLLTNGGRPIPWWVGIVASVAIMGANFGLSIVLGVVLGIIGTLGDDPVAAFFSPPALFAQLVFGFCVFAGVAWVLPKGYGHRPARWLALRPVGLGLVGLSVVGVVGLGFLVDQVLFIIHNASPTTFPTQGLEAFNTAFQNAPLPWFLVLTVLVAIGPGLGEELFFRGLVFKSFAGSMPSWLAVFLSAALFGVIHGNLLQGMGAFLIGIYLGIIVIRTGSIWPCVVAHAANNLLSALFARFDPGTAEEIYKAGHPLWLVGVAALVTGAVMAVLLKPRRD